jgi:integrase
MPRDRGARTRIDRGIYRDAAGVEVQVMVAGQRRSARFPLATGKGVLRDARERLRAELRASAGRARRPGTGTLAADAVRYLAAVRSMPSYADRARDIAAWVGVFGDRTRDSLQPVDVATQLHTWRQAGKAPQTCNHLRTALSQLYARLDGPDGRNPARAVKKFPTEPPLPRAIPQRAVAAILRHMRKDGKTRARLAVIASTGLAHAELRRLQPADVQLEAGHVIARARRKGAGSAPRVIPLTRRARAALRLFVRLDAFGPFGRSSMHSAFRRACASAGYGDTDWRPYDLRHTFGTAVVLASGDEKAAQILLGHASASTTGRYTLGAAQARAQAAITAMDRRRK